jgi:glycosyltransferase involved in cell wall biosynthesis
MKRNLLFLSHSSEMNGAEITLLHLLEELDRSRFRAVLVIPSLGPLAEKASAAGIEVRTVPFKWRLSEKRNIGRQPLSWLWNRMRIPAVARIMEEENIHLVFSNSAAAACGAEAARRSGIPHVWSIHEILTGREPILHYVWGQRRLIRLIEGMSCRIIVNSRATAASFTGSAAVRIVTNGVRPAPEEPLENLERELQLGKGPVLGVVGKLYRGKGQREALQALGVLRKHFPDIRLLLMGGVSDSRYKRELESLVAAGGLQAHVRFLGQRRDGRRLMRLMHLLLVPSRVDSFGLAALDAMSAGTPVVALKAGGLPEIVKDGINGSLFPDLEAETIAGAVKRVLEDAAFRASLIREGLKSVLEEFTVARQAAETESVLEECLLGERE